MLKKLISLISIVVFIIITSVGCSSSNTTERQSSIDMSDVDSSDIYYFTSELSDRVRDQYSLDSTMYIDYDESTNFAQIHIPLDGEYLSDEDINDTREAILTDKKTLGSRIVDIFNDTILAYQDAELSCNVVLQVTDDNFDEHGVVFEVYCNHTISLQDIQDREDDVYNTGSVMID